MVPTSKKQDSKKSEVCCTVSQEAVQQMLGQTQLSKTSMCPNLCISHMEMGGDPAKLKTVATGLFQTVNSPSPGHNLEVFGVVISGATKVTMG